MKSESNACRIEFETDFSYTTSQQRDSTQGLENVSSEPELKLMPSEECKTPMLQES